MLNNLDISFTWPQEVQYLNSLNSLWLNSNSKSNIAWEKLNMLPPFVLHLYITWVKISKCILDLEHFKSILAVASQVSTRTRHTDISTDHTSLKLTSQLGAQNSSLANTLPHSFGSVLSKCKKPSTPDPTQNLHSEAGRQLQELVMLYTVP